MSEGNSISVASPVYERLEALFDAGSFVEIDKYLERSNAVAGYPDVSAPGEGVVAGLSLIHIYSVSAVQFSFEGEIVDELGRFSLAMPLYPNIGLVQ